MLCDTTACTEACKDSRDWIAERDGGVSRALGIRGVSQGGLDTPRGGVEQPQGIQQERGTEQGILAMVVGQDGYGADYNGGWSGISGHGRANPPPPVESDLQDVRVEDAPGQEKMTAGKQTSAEDEEVSPCCILYGPRMDEEHIMKYGKWLCYCCCGGVGWLESTHSPCHCLTKCICVAQTCEMVEHESREGMCGSMHTCCFCTPMFQWPPPEGVPLCMLCSAMFCGVTRTEKHKEAAKEVKIEDEPLTFFQHVVYEHHQPCFCKCLGCGCQPFFQTIYDAYFKCFCMRCTCNVQPPCEEAGLVLCNSVWNAGLCICQCRFPFQYKSNPIVACCGTKCKHHVHKPGLH